MSPDRVPPPATRTPAPGTAQPYYPGDPVPQLQPGSVMPPGYGAPAAAPVTPAAPNNWNPQPPTPGAITPSNYQVTPVSAEVPVSQAATIAEQPIQIQPDNVNLRFHSAPIQTLGEVPPIAPEQSVLPTQFQQDFSPANVPSLPPVVNVIPQEVTIRAIPTPGSPDSTNAAGFRAPSTDGFRPQGSHRRNGAQSSHAPASDRFGFDPQYQWLRGQLEFQPATRQWFLRYTSPNEPTDQFAGQLQIANSVVLGNLQPGDYVQVQGQVVSDPSGLHGYNISAVQRQR